MNGTNADIHVLVADDQPMQRELLRQALQSWGYRLTLRNDGRAAWEYLQHEPIPDIVILDWEMPGLTGPEVCQRLRAAQLPVAPYVILLTARESTDDIVFGLSSGADDYLTKPFEEAELAARLGVAVRTRQLQLNLATRIVELEVALATIKRLRNILPMCAWCKKIRNDENYWQQVEEYLAQNSETKVTHGICPQCFEKTLRGS